MNSFNITEYLKDRARDSGDQPAIIIPKGKGTNFKQTSYHELDLYSDSYGDFLLKRGVRSGEKVLVMVRPGLELIGIAFALLKKGIVPILIDPGMGLKPFIDCVGRTRPDYLIGITPALLLSKFFRNAFSSIKGSFWVREGCLKKTFESDLTFTPKSVLDAKENQLAAILFTSGSTGPAKGVCYTYGLFSSQIDLVRNQFGIQKGEVDLPMLPIFALFNPALGMTTVVPPMNPSKPAKSNASLIVQTIQSIGVTNSFGSPVLWNKINDYCEQNNQVLPSIRRVLIAGAAVSRDLVQSLKEKLPNGDIYTPYGATECLPVCGISHIEILKREENVGLGTLLGRPLDGVFVKVIEPVNGEIDTISDVQELGCSEVGEIIVKGPIVTQEYYQLPDVTRESKIKEGSSFWHRIGDLGYLDTEGFLWFAGRKVERVITDKKTYYPDFVEKFMNTHEWVYRSALLKYKKGKRWVPAIGIELRDFSMIKKRGCLELRNSLLSFLEGSEFTSDIKYLFFWKSFPVDVRHNAKIHRIAMSKQLEDPKWTDRDFIV